MSIRFKTLLLTSLILFVAIGGLFWFAQSNLSQGFAALENRDAEKNVGRAKDAFSAELEAIETKMIDWSRWDDSYHFMEKHNDEFISSNLKEETLISMKLQLLIFFDSNGKITWGKNIGLEKVSDFNESEKKYLENQKYLFETGKEGAWVNNTGYIQFNNQLFMITAQAILKSDTTGPSRGLILAGRAIDDDKIKKLGATTHLDLEAFSLDQNLDPKISTEVKEAMAKLQKEGDFSIKTLDANTILGYSLFFNLEKKPFFVLQMKTQREIKNLGDQTISVLLSAISGIGVLLLFSLIILLNKIIISRVQTLSQSVLNIGKNRNWSLRIPELGLDEIGTLGQSTNSMLESLEESQHSVKRLLNNTGQGFMTIDAHGIIKNEMSDFAKKMFGKNPASLKYSEFFDSSIHANIDDTIETIFTEALAFSDLKNFLPKNLTLIKELNSSESSYFEFSYKEIRDEKTRKISEILIIADDRTEIKNKNDQLELERTINSALIKILNAPAQFAEVLDEMYSLHKKTNDSVDFIRSLHTLKGGFGLYECKFISEICHLWESELKKEINVDLMKKAISEVVMITEEFLEKHKEILKIKKGEDRVLLVPRQSIMTYLHQLDSQGLPSHLFKALDQMLERPISDILNWLDRVLYATAAKLGKEVDPIQWIESFNINPIGYEELFRSLVHVARNTADHAIEGPEERAAFGKDSVGKLKVRAWKDEAHYYLDFSDNGRGIDVAKLREGLKPRFVDVDEWSDSDVLDTIFQMGISLKENVTEFSGRGVGLDSVRHEARNLGGDAVILDNKLGEGLNIRVYFKQAHLLQRVKRDHTVEGEEVNDDNQKDSQNTAA